MTQRNLARSVFLMSTSALLITIIGALVVAGLAGTVAYIMVAICKSPTIARRAVKTISRTNR